MQPVRRPGPHPARGNIDDLALALFLHLGIDGAATEEHAPEVHRHHPVPFPDVDPVPWLARKFAHQGGVVDQPVDAPVSLDRRFGHAPDRLFIRNVGRLGDRHAALGDDLLGHFDAGLGIDVGDDKLGPGRRQMTAIDLAETLAAAGDDDRPAGEIEARLAR